MAAPWYVYLIGLVSVAPIYFLLAVGAYGLVRSIGSWVFGADTPAAQPAPSKGRSVGS